MPNIILYHVFVSTVQGYCDDFARMAFKMNKQYVIALLIRQQALQTIMYQ